MKVMVRHEPATHAGAPPGSEATPDRTCAWIVGDNGETTETAYLEGHQELPIDVGVLDGSVGVLSFSFGPVIELAPSDAEAEELLELTSGRILWRWAPGSRLITGSTTDAEGSPVNEVGSLEVPISVPRDLAGMADFLGLPAPEAVGA